MGAVLTCSTRHALDTILPINAQVGPVYPTQWEMPNCDVVGGVPTKTCHCAEQNWIFSTLDPATELPAEQQAGAGFETIGSHNLN